MNTRLPFVVLALFVLLSAASCRSGKKADGQHVGSRTEAVSLFGDPLERIEPSDEALADYTTRLDHARDQWRATYSEESAIWVGRYLGYLGRYGEAIEWFSERLVNFPGSYRLLRHRGHRYLSIREFELAEADLDRAYELCANLPNEVEPDGAPNRYGIPRGTTQTSVLYHLGLALYLQAEFDAAAGVWTECLARSTTDDMRVATLNWLYHALRRGGHYHESRVVAASATRDMEVIENFAYHRLVLLYNGTLIQSEVMPDPEDGIQNATAAYGLANWSWCNGNRERAIELWEEIVSTTPWNAFGHIAAEAELVRREAR